MVNGVGDVGGLITTAVGLGVTLGALGLAFEFADRAIDRTAPRNGKRPKRRPIFDTGFGNNQSGNIFDPIGRPARRAKTKTNGGRRRTSMDDIFSGGF